MSDPQTRPDAQQAEADAVGQTEQGADAADSRAGDADSGVGRSEPGGDEFDAEVPSEAPSPHADDDWPEGGLEDDGRDEAVVTTDDPVHPAIGERFADAHAARPWLLPSIAAAAVVAIVAIVALTRRD